MRAKNKHSCCEWVQAIGMLLSGLGLFITAWVASCKTGPYVEMLKQNQKI